MDNESLVDILFYETFCKMNLSVDRLKRINSPLIRFLENLISMKGALYHNYLDSKVNDCDVRFLDYKSTLSIHHFRSTLIGHPLHHSIHLLLIDKISDRIWCGGSPRWLGTSSIVLCGDPPSHRTFQIDVFDAWD